MGKIPYDAHMTALGINLVYQTTDWFGLDRNRTITDMLALPVVHVRLPIRMRDVWHKKHSWDFSVVDTIIHQAIASKKKIHLQIGLKTLGWPEVHAPSWMHEECAFLNTPYCRIDDDPRIQEYVFTYLETIATRYFEEKAIASIHVENEPFSRHLEVSQYRHLSPSFVKQEATLVRKLDPYHRPLVQNIPFDTPQAIPSLRTFDILGLNVYPQTGHPWYFRYSFWPGMRSLFFLAKLMGKPLWITEYQAAAWLTEAKKSRYPFDAELAKQGLERLENWNPGIIFLWDVEQLLWQKNHSLLFSLLGKHLD